MADVKLPKVDVVVVGLGAAGGTAVLPLTQAGMDVVALEAGGRYTTRDFAPDELRNDIRNWLGRAKFNGEMPTWRAKPSDEAGPGAVNIGMANGVGGTSIHYTMQYWRFLPWNFKTRSETVARYGEAALGSSTVADWPFGYEDLEPYYDKVEYLLGASGQAGNVGGTTDEAGNVYEGPRSRPYPNPPMRASGFTELMSTAAKSLGHKPFPGPTSIRSQPYEGHPGCMYCGFCTNHGCHANAKGSTMVNGIPEAEEAGLKVVTYARVTEVTVDGEGKASGVRYVRGGQTYVQPAGVVLVGTYAYENTRLLLTSVSKAYPKGIANNAGQVGQHYASHVYAFFNGLFPDQRLNRVGPGSQRITFDDLNGDNFDHSGLDFIGGGVMDAGMEWKPIGAARTSPPSVGRWGADWRAWIAQNAGSVASGGGQLESLTYEDSFLDLDPVKKDALGIPVVRVTFDLHDQEKARYDYFQAKSEEWLKEAGASEVWVSFPKIPIAVNSHAYGGTRMGDDPDTSVVNGFGMAHEVPNLGVLGGSTFPTTAGYNPTETIQATAWRTADHVIDQYDSLSA